MNLLLADPRPEDGSRIAAWQSDPDLSRQLIRSHTLTDESQAIEWIRINSEDAGQCLQGIYQQEGDVREIQGIARLMFIDFESRTAEFGIYVGNLSNQGKGVGGAALDMMLEKAFSELLLEKVYLKVVAFNKRAIALYTRKNFKIEGVLRQHHRLDGKFHDVICMAIFKGDLS